MVPSMACCLQKAVYLELPSGAAKVQYNLMQSLTLVAYLKNHESANILYIHKTFFFFKRIFMKLKMLILLVVHAHQIVNN